MKYCATVSGGINQRAHLLSPFFLHHQFCLQGMLSINIKAETTLIQHCYVELCYTKFLSYENIEGLPVLLCILRMLIVLGSSLYNQSLGHKGEEGRVVVEYICCSGDQVQWSHGCCTPSGLGRQRLKTCPTNVRGSTCCHELLPR